MASSARVVLVLLLLLGLGVAATGTDALAQDQGRVPGGTLGNAGDAEMWRAIRQGERMSVTLPDQKAGVLIQSEGDNWRAVRNGPLFRYGGWALGGVVLLLLLFLIVRGRIRVEGGLSGRTIRRFNGIERFAHWLGATTFVILALTGLNMLYGRYVLMPLIGQDLFALLLLGGKYAHDYLAFGFMVGLVLMFVLWVWSNIPTPIDVVWLLKGGGLLTKGTHPPSRKFNAGQKILFWLVILGGASVSLSGIMLLFPFQLEMFGPTAQFIDEVFHRHIPAEFTPLQEMQLAQLWHAIMGLLLIVVILGHIYIGSIGMEGAFDAMGSGEVDLNWAREHHNLWVEKLEEKGALPAPGAAPGGDD